MNPFRCPWLEDPPSTRDNSAGVCLPIPVHTLPPFLSIGRVLFPGLPAALGGGAPPPPPAVPLGGGAPPPDGR